MVHVPTSSLFGGPGATTRVHNMCRAHTRVCATTGVVVEKWGWAQAMEALLNRVAKLGAGVAAAAFVGNNFLYTGQSAHLLDPFIDGTRIPDPALGHTRVLLYVPHQHHTTDDLSPVSEYPTCSTHVVDNSRHTEKLTLLS